jgi:hypothetical protein
MTVRMQGVENFKKTFKINNTFSSSPSESCGCSLNLLSGSEV